ncbi:MAG: exonuclease domain-containing protein [Acidobacteriota bacterium]|nr:exonuclease domain-containing protein [Acidobacteriota bacterium]
MKMKAQSWHESPWIGFDCETTGTDPNTARILEAAVITRDPAGAILEDDRVIYINPGVPIPPEASAIHGITEEKLKAENAWESSAGIPYVYGIITARAILRQNPLVIYNAPYDWQLLMAECKRIPEFCSPGIRSPLFLDPLVIDRALDKYRKGSRRLEDVAKFYGVELKSAHGAHADAVATLGVMRALIDKYPELKSLDLPTMQTMQANWYAEWRDHINGYWERTGKADRVTGRWPGGEEEA